MRPVRPSAARLGGPPTNKSVRGSVFSFFEPVDGRISRYRLFLHAAFPDAVIVDTSRLRSDSADRFRQYVRQLLMACRNVWTLCGGNGRVQL